MAAAIPGPSLADLFDRATVGRKAIDVDPAVAAFVTRVAESGGHAELPPVPVEQIPDLKAQIRAAVLAANQSAVIRQHDQGDGSVVLTVSIGERRGRKAKGSEANGSAPDSDSGGDVEVSS
jgi:hypothetical protein